MRLLRYLKDNLVLSGGDASGFGEARPQNFDILGAVGPNIKIDHQGPLVKFWRLEFAPPPPQLSMARRHVLAFLSVPGN